ncbi:MAG: hypothetical protein U1A04_03120 [Moraxellaceae bacterium]|nr:hypothetical protein [Moraxellaceae bacterium]
MQRDPNREMMIQVVLQLGELAEQLIFVGGVTAGLLITDPAAPSVRPTKDVDVIAIIKSHTDYYAFGDALRARGFKEDQSIGAPICRWVSGGWILDVMPINSNILGFSNRWYELAAETAELTQLVNDVMIRVISAPCFLGTKFEAFHGRGRGDFIGSHDMEDMIGVIEGRPELINECAQAPDELRRYLQAQFTALIANNGFNQALPGHVLDAGRLPIVRQRLAAIAMGHVERTMK